MPKDKSRFNLPDAKHLLTAGGLVVGTLGTLLLGAALQVDPQTVASESAAVLTTPPIAGGSVAPTRPAPLPPSPGPAAEAAPERTPEGRATDAGRPRPTPAAQGLAWAERTDDVRRLLANDHEWTLQFMVTCNDDSAARLLQDVHNDARLYLLPLSMDGRDCFRICWNTYRSRDRAMAATDIPAALRSINAEPIARLLTDVTR